jgi:hypothetical protein
MGLLRFDDIDAIRFLREVVKLHVQHYREDFDLDEGILRTVSMVGRPEDRRLLWMARPSGTWCLRERPTYIKGTREHSIWKFYGEQTGDEILAFAIELEARKDGRAIGTVYELDYQKHYRNVVECALPLAFKICHFEDGTECSYTREALDRAKRESMERYGKEQSFVLVPHPEDEDKLATVLDRERFELGKDSVPGKADEYLRGLTERKAAQDKNPSVIRQITDTKRKAMRTGRSERAASAGKGRER